MKRRIAIIIVFLLLGAIVNVAVAWGCALMLDVWRLRLESSDWSHKDSGDGWDWVVQVREVRGARMVASVWQSYDLQARGEWDGRSDQAAIDPEPHETLKQFELRAVHHFESQVFSSRGLPFLSMWCERDTVAPHGIDSLPLRAHWPGFILNTLFYAALLWLLFIAPFAARRMIRPRNSQP